MLVSTGYQFDNYASISGDHEPGKLTVHVLGGVAQTAEGVRLLGPALARLRSEATPGTPEFERVPSGRGPRSSSP